MGKFLVLFSAFSIAIAVATPYKGGHHNDGQGGHHNDGHIDLDSGKGIGIPQHTVLGGGAGRTQGHDNSGESHGRCPHHHHHGVENNGAQHVSHSTGGGGGFGNHQGGYKTYGY